MSGYVPSNFDTTNPTDAVIAETAQAEFRNMKSFFQGTLGRLLTPINISNVGGTQIPISITIPAGSLKTNKKLRIITFGAISNATGGTQGIEITQTFGGGVYFNDVFSIPNGANYAFKFIFELTNSGATNMQAGMAEYHMFNSTNLGFTNPETAGFPCGGINTTGGADTTVDQLYQFSLSLSVASAAFAIGIYSGIVEWV